jgi:fructose-specific phosphotransferase system IIA component
MNLLSVLDERTIVLDLKGQTKTDIIDELLDVLMVTGKVNDRTVARQAIMDREQSLSTGMKNGIALPHGKTEAVGEMIACIGLSRTGVPFESMDGEPSNLFIMTLSPKNKTGPHLQFLAEVSRLFKSEEKREHLAKATSAAEVLEWFGRP